MKKDITLFLNCAEEYIQVALGCDNQLEYGIKAKSNRQGIVLIPKMVEKCLNLSGVAFEDLTKIAVVIGPGSFTGIRIAISYGIGISMGQNIPLGGINYLELLSQNAYFAIKGNVFVITYAKINMVNVQGFSGPNPIKAITPPMCCEIDELKKIVPKRCYLLGSGVRKYQGIFQTQEILSPFFDTPSFDSLLCLGKKIEYTYSPPKPMYLRASDAEENLKTILKKRGL